MIQYWTEDKVPELLRSGGHELAAGVASAGGSIGHGLAIGFEHQREDKKRKEDELKAEAKLTKHARGILDVLDPENKHANSQLGGDEARGRAAGLYQRNLMDKYAAEVAAEKRQAEAANEFKGFSEIFAHVLRGGTFAAPREVQEDYYQNPESERYAAGPPRPTPRDAFAAGLEAHPGAAAHPQFDNILKTFGAAQREQFIPRGGTVRAGDVDVPYITRDDGSIVPMPEFVKGNPKYPGQKATSGHTAGKGPILSEDKMFYWDEKNGQWKERRTQRESIGDYLNDDKGGTSGAPAAAQPDAYYVPGRGLVKPSMYGKPGP